MSQSHYISEMPKMDYTRYVNKAGEVTDSEMYRTAAKQALGSLIWFRQARPDIGFNLAKIATDAENSRTTGDLSTKLIALYNKTLRYMKSYGRKLRYVFSAAKTMTPEKRWAAW